MSSGSRYNLDAIHVGINALGKYHYNKTINTDKPMKKIRITDKDGIVNEFNEGDVKFEIVDAPEGFKPIGVPMDGEIGYWIKWDSDLQCLDQEHARNYAEAMNVLFELWACDGVVDSEKAEFDATYQIYGDLEIFITHSPTVRNAYITPPFESNTTINAAIQKVGPERIKKMFRSFKFIK